MFITIYLFVHFILVIPTYFLLKNESLINHKGMKLDPKFNWKVSDFIITGFISLFFSPIAFIIVTMHSITRIIEGKWNKPSKI